MEKKREKEEWASIPTDSNNEKLEHLKKRHLNEWFASKWGQWVIERARLPRLRYVMVSSKLLAQRESEWKADIYVLYFLKIKYQGDRLFVLRSHTNSLFKRCESVGYNVHRWKNL